jgi:hypothetical protein
LLGNLPIASPSINQLRSRRYSRIFAERGLPTIPDGTDGEPRVTFHSLRRTYAALAAEANADPAWTATQIGHADPRFTLRVYMDVRNRRQRRASRIGDVIRSSEWAGTGRNDADDGLDAEATELLRPEEPAELRRVGGTGFEPVTSCL